MNHVVLGAGGLLGTDVVSTLRSTDAEVHALGSSDLDVRDAAATRGVLAALRPDVVWNCAAYTAVDRAEEEADQALAVNRDGAAHVAAGCREVGATMVHFSTDFVFDGEGTMPYQPNDDTGPQSVYARSKLAGEEAVLQSGADHLLIRTSWLFGAGGRHFVQIICDRAREGLPLRVVDDQVGRPTWTRTVAESGVELLAKGVRGIVHVADRGTASWLELAQYALTLQGIHAEIEGVSTADWGAPAARPAYSVLALEETERVLGRRFYTWRETLKRLLEEDAG